MRDALAAPALRAPLDAVVAAAATLLVAEHIELRGDC
jgi:hypothetical protein